MPKVLLYPILVCQNKNVMGKRVEFCPEPRLKWHIYSHGGKVKVGVKMKNKFECRKAIKKEKRT